MTVIRSNLATRAALASAGVALFLLVLKASAAAQTGSVALLGSLADTILDVVASLATLYGVRLAAQPADYDHRFGHGKAEALAALFQVVVIALSAAAILFQAVLRLSAGRATAHVEYGIGVSLVAILVTALLLVYQRSVIARTGSVAIGADHVHYQSDVLINLAVIAALVLDHYLGVVGADPVFGILIAGWLMFGAWRASRLAVDQLMDREWPDAKRARFLSVAAELPALKGMHDLRTRTSGTRDFVQFHIYVAPELNVAQAHDVMDEIEDHIERAFPGMEVLIHVDPEGQVDREGALPKHIAEEQMR